MQLQPDLVQAHYFLGLAYFAAAERDAANYSNAARHLLDAARVGPQWQPTWFVLSYAALLTGDYERAEQYAGTAAGDEPRAQGAAVYRGGDCPGVGEAQAGGSAWSARAADGVSGADDGVGPHVPRCDERARRRAFWAMWSCGTGTVRTALAAYRRGWHTVQENPRIMAYRRTAARAQAGLAAAYAANGDRTRAGELLGRAKQTAADSELPEHSAAAASMAELYWTMAVGWARLGDARQTLEIAARAVRTGWRDAEWMERDPELRNGAGERGIPGVGGEVRRHRRCDSRQCSGAM